jgi:hypothetical protein
VADYKVGYGKPASKAQFKKGQSGNPRGRPKGRRNLATVLHETLNEPTVIVVDGVKRTVTKLEAAVKKAVEIATTGDMHAFRIVTTLTLATEDPTAPQTIAELAPQDQKLLQRLARRFAS